MTAMSIQQQADIIRELIQNSRENIADGRFIDISKIEQKITSLYHLVAENPAASLDVDVKILAGLLAKLMSEMDNLEADLALQHKGLNAETTVSSTSAAAAYRS